MTWYQAVAPIRMDQALVMTALLMFCALPTRAGEAPPYLARAGLDLATEAATVWAPDAELVYLENDEDVIAGGTAVRWGYLFNSKSLGRARGYTIRDGEILEAANLDFDFEAPPLPAVWVDSDVALAAAEDKAGRKYREANGGRLATMLLIRGAFHDGDPDASTWTLVYTSPGEPPLTVVVDARNGKVVRKWRG
jgi:hypothetical protein